jgi:hypothetical protein
MDRRAGATLPWAAIFVGIYRDMAIEPPRPRTNLSTSIAQEFSPSSKPLFDARGALEKRRRRIWELSNYLHCSVIGTCLTTAELRQILIRMAVSSPTSVASIVPLQPLVKRLCLPARAVCAAGGFEGYRFQVLKVSISTGAKSGLRLPRR